MATPSKTLAIVTGLIALYPNANVTEATITAYVGMLKDIPDDILSAGANNCASKCKWFPTVAELREAAFNVRDASISQPTALEAWGQVKAMVGAYGYYRIPDVTDFADPIAGETILTLGWQDFCLSDLDDEMSWRARFCDLYESKRQREREWGRMLPEVRQTITRRLGGTTPGQIIGGMLLRPKSPTG